jgi:hypothetical protein
MNVSAVALYLVGFCKLVKEGKPCLVFFCKLLVKEEGRERRFSVWVCNMNKIHRVHSLFQEGKIKAHNITYSYIS